MKLRVVLVSVVSASLAMLGACSLGDVREVQGGESIRGMLHFSYDAGPSTLPELVESAEAILVASPTGDEFILASFDDGVQIMGQTFATLSVLKGSVPAGSNITVLRTALSAEPTAGELPFSHAEYILGLRQSTTYSTWVTLGGPAGRIAFGDDGTAVVEDEGIAVQEQAAGMSLAQLVALIEALTSPPALHS